MNIELIQAHINAYKEKDNAMRLLRDSLTQEDKSGLEEDLRSIMEALVDYIKMELVL